MSDEGERTSSGQNLDYRTYLDERKALVDGEVDVASRFDKSILTLSGGALLLSMTFVKDIASKPNQTWTLFTAWVFLAVAICLMLVSLLTSQNAFRRQRVILEGTLEEEGRKPASNVWASWTHRLNVASIIAFIAALVLMSIFVFLNMPRS